MNDNQNGNTAPATSPATLDDHTRPVPDRAVVSSTNANELANNGVVDEVTDKKGYARRWHCSVRSCDNWLALGMPHFKLSPRRVRTRVSEADEWMQNQFGTRRIGPANRNN